MPTEIEKTQEHNNSGIITEELNTNNVLSKRKLQKPAKIESRNSESACTSHEHNNNINAENHYLKRKLQELQRQLAAALAKQLPLQAGGAADNLQPAVVAADNPQPAVVAEPAVMAAADNLQPAVVAADNPQPAVVAEAAVMAAEIPVPEIENDEILHPTIKPRWAKGGRNRGRGRGRGRGRECRGNKTIINYINM